jgi:NADH:ubiquinone oxidoreductase subunit 5 (subunit L)/multisubunit Na+/H+ antiporter MnhA subunit
MAMALLFVDFGTLNLYEISFISLFLKPYFIVLIPPKYGIFLVYFTNVEVICICLFIAVMSKSAQFGLHMWLPDAMEGPTPVSALIHAATMVTAGVYLMVRLAALFMLAPAVLDFAIIVGALTMIFGATTAFSQSDIKKIIAFSTCSQLGYMIVACGLAHFSVAFFHLVTHAFFKALLFLCAGIIIHSVDGEQDVRRLGAMRNQFPLVYVSFAIASAALMGIPFFSGYYSKDLIIGLACFTQTWVAYFAGDMAVHAAWFTSMYSMKLLLCVF